MVCVAEDLVVCVAEAHSAEATVVPAEAAPEVEVAVWAEAMAMEDVVNTLTSAFIIRCTSDIVQCA